MANTFEYEDLLDDLDDGKLPMVVALPEVECIFYTVFTVKESSQLKSNIDHLRKLTFCQVMKATHDQALRQWWTENDHE